MTAPLTAPLVAELAAGETVLDLGSGAGLDVLLSARRVGPSGLVYGLVMTDDMLQLARGNAADAGASNVEFLRGHIEAIPLPDAAVDVVISNCVINLSTDKPAVFAEIARVLRPGGRVGIADLFADSDADPARAAADAAAVGAITGVLAIDDYRAALCQAGLVDATVTATAQVGEVTHSAIVPAAAAGLRRSGPDAWRLP